ncbi:hypothetical protein [Ramlibacter sp.]|uniref:hypothetical protein n=1 Tax=Ramlibacter sp. TaxID=1917967 RepID=UPI003D13E12F
MKRNADAFADATARIGVLAAIVTLAAIASANPAIAAEIPLEPPAPQRGGTFYEPPARVDPVFAPKGPNQPGDPLADGRGAAPLVLRASVDIPLRRVEIAAGQGTQGSRAVSPTFQLSGRWQPQRFPGVFVELTLLRYLRAERQQPWNPDFTYGFGYEDLSPGGWGLTYANFTGTRIEGGRFNFPQGQWSLVQRFLLSQALEDFFLAGNGDAVLCTVGGHLTPRYATAESAELRHNKFALSLGCRYTLAGGVFAQATAFLYPRGEQQQPWDPDYNWALGWEKATARGAWLMQYANYSGNRFPGREAARGEGGLRGGSVTLSWTAAW